MADSKVTFGTAEYKNVCAGIYITNISFDEGSQKAEVMDEEGNIVQQDRYGCSRTIDNIAYTIDTVRKTKTNTGHYTVNVTASAPFTVATT